MLPRMATRKTTIKRRGKQTGKKSEHVAAVLSSVAARIRYARVYSKMEPIELRRRLKEKGISLSKQLLHRYETAESQNPNLAIVEAIAEVSGFSPGWLLFGKGPVFVIDPFTQIVRNLNLEVLYRRPKREWPSTAKLRTSGTSSQTIERLRACPFAEPVTDKVARAVELAVGKPVGWLDSPPESLSDVDRGERLIDVLRIMGEALKLDDDQRNAFIDFLATLANASMSK